ncbi:MAG: outer membrane beta-barrel protein [Xanthobacteraceae bacterium]
MSNASNTDWLWTFRGRIGWLAQPNLLAYVTGGGAVTRLSTSMNYSDTTGAVANAAAAATKTGWVVGGGVEWLLTDHWTVKGEFLYLNFGAVTASASVPSVAKATAIGTINTKADLTAEIARLGVNYKF